jgi:hypothetical protein
MKNSKVNVISSVQNSVSSIFSKEDVLFLINSIEEAEDEDLSTFGPSEESEMKSADERELEEIKRIEEDFN